MRLFFASWPPPEVARALARWAALARRDCGGRATREERIHLTLAFLGEAEPDAAQALARGVRAAPGTLVLEAARYQGRRRIVWAEPKESPAWLAALASELGEKGAYAAHVTLLRKARAPRRLPEFAALEWPVREFLLVRSQLRPSGPSYEVLERYALV